MSISNNVQSLFKDPSITNAVRVGMKINPLSQAARAIVEGGFRAAGALGSTNAQKQVDKIDQEYEKNRKELSEQKRGGRVKKYKAGGTTKAKKFAALAPPYNKATAADRIAGAKKNSRKK